MTVTVELLDELHLAGVLGLPLAAVPAVVLRSLLARRLAEFARGRVRLTPAGRRLAELARVAPPARETLAEADRVRP